MLAMTVVAHEANDTAGNWLVPWTVEQGAARFLDVLATRGYQLVTAESEWREGRDPEVTAFRVLVPVQRSLLAEAPEPVFRAIAEQLRDMAGRVERGEVRP